ncbi:helix-turn-helix domain-containing protein [Persicobacter diffluens]|uniref:Transcriptional regulator n=1 Tax=Persicobacter diffluens TaxID=981 RepID=A0AAN4W078_9BACT|nr:transcriptional regulator [Persicobacter diffluens]
MFNAAKIFKFSTFINSPEEHFHIARTAIGAEGDLQLHAHDYAEFFYVSSGNGWHYINGAEQPIEKGSFCFIRPQDQHTFKGSRAKGLVITNLALRWETVQQYRQRYFSDSDFYWKAEDQPPFHGKLEADVLQSLIKRVDILLGQTKGLMNLDLFMLHLFDRMNYAQEEKASIPAWLSAALEQFRFPVNLQAGQEGFLALCQRSGDHVNRMMKTCYQKTLTEMINVERMNYVSRQLVMTNAPLKAIYTEAGFHNHSYFFRLFKKQFGLTPLEYREKHHKVF